MSGKSRSQKRAILSATSALAIIVGLGGNAWACQSLGTFAGGNFPAFTNFGTLDCINITNHTTLNGNLSNASTGVIGPPGGSVPATVSIDSSTISGTVQNSGQINASGGSPGGIKVTGGSVIGGGIINNKTGTINVNVSGPSAFGIQVAQSSFTGGITNNGAIVVNNSSGSSVGIQVGGGSSPPPPPASINPSSLTTPTIKTTSNFSPPSGNTWFGNNRNKHH
jgi:hypothetical protein